MEPNLNSKILKNHRSGFQFCLSAFLIATNAFIGLLVISFLEYNLFLLLGVLFGYPVLYLQYVCSYALLIRSNYLGRNDIIKRDLLLSLCPFIRFVKTHLFAANLLSIFTSTIFCFYITIKN